MSREIGIEARHSVGAENFHVVTSSPLSRGASGKNPTQFLSNFYEWACLNRGQVVEFDPGPMASLPDKEGFLNYAVDCLKLYIERLPPHVVGIQESISNLPQNQGPLSEESCDLAFWDWAILKFLDFREKPTFLDRIEELMKINQDPIRRELMISVMSASDHFPGEFQALADEVTKDSAEIRQRLSGATPSSSLRGILNTIKTRGYFVETNVEEIDIRHLSDEFRRVGGQFSEAHYIVPADADSGDDVWALALRKAVED
jgi:hypothetical protein